MTITASSRQRLDAIRERTHNARSRRTKARQQLDAAREAGDNDAQAIAQIAFDTADEDLQVAERLESQLLSSISGLDGGGLGEGILNDPGTIETPERLGNGRFPIGSVDLGPLGSRDELVEKINTGSWGQPKMAADVDIPDSARIGTTYGSGTVAQPRRRLSILDIIPASTMDGRSFGYLQESGELDTGAAETAEGAVKPEGSVTLDVAEVVAATIAEWVKLRRQQLADVPSLGQTINDRLTYKVLRRLEHEILSGSGTGENIQDILGMTGIGSISFSASVALTDLVLDGVVATLLSEAEPDAVAVNPQDWATMLKAREGANSGQRLDSAGAFAATPVRLWGLPAVPSTALAVGEALGRVRHLRPPVHPRGGERPRKRSPSSVGRLSARRSWPSGP